MTVRAAAACSALLTGRMRRPDTAAPTAKVERARLAMGSELRLTAWTADEPAAVAAFEEVFAEFDRLESLMSVWRAGSDVRG